MKTPRLGALPPRYNFVLNPYPEGVWRCPYCEERTRQKKVPLLIHVDPGYPLALNYTCRYCLKCDLLIAHKIEVEHLLYEVFRQMAPEAIGNRYLIIGTVEKGAWREGLKKPTDMSDALKHVSDFAGVYEELRYTRPGYYRAEEQPPMMEPPASLEWTPIRRDRRRRS